MAKRYRAAKKVQEAKLFRGFFNMKCQRCGVGLPGSRGAYRWRSEVVALGEDVLCPTGIEENGKTRRHILEELAVMTSEEIEQDVYQLWEGVLCHCCRFELGRILGLFMNKK